MAGSRKKLVTEYKGLLREKIARVTAKERDIVEHITNVSKETFALSRDLLEETDKKLFLKKYQDVNGQLEVCMNTLLMLSSRLPSHSIDSGSSSSSSDSSDNDDDDDEDGGKTSETPSDKPLKSSKNSQQSKRGLDQKAGQDTNKQDKRPGQERSDTKSDGKRTSSEDAKKSRQRRDQHFYESPKSRSLPPSRIATHHSPTRDSQTSQRRKRSLSSEHVPSARSPQNDRRQPRHSSSPGRLECKQPVESRSPYSERRFSRDSGFTDARRQSPSARHRSPEARQKPSGGRFGPPASGRPRTPPAARNWSPPSRNRSHGPRNQAPRFSSCRFFDSEQHSSSGPRNLAAGYENRSADDKHSNTAHGPELNSSRAAHINRQPQQRRTSTSPDRKFDNSRQRSPPGRYTHHGNNPPYTREQRNKTGGRNANSPSYACSSPPRSASLLQDHEEKKKHGELEMASQPLVIPTEELHKLTLELQSSSGRSSPSQNNSQEIKVTGDVQGRHEPSVSPSAALAPKDAQQVHRQVTSSARGQIMVTVKPERDKEPSQNKEKASPDVMTKVAAKDHVVQKAPPGLAKLTDVSVAKVKETSHVPQQLSPRSKPGAQHGPREVLPQVTQQLSTRSQPGTQHGPREVLSQVTQQLSPRSQPSSHHGPREVLSSQQRVSQSRRYPPEPVVFQPQTQSTPHQPQPTVRQVTTSQVQSNQHIHTQHSQQGSAATHPVQLQEPSGNHPQRPPNQVPAKPVASSTGPAASAEKLTSPIASVKLIHGSAINVVVCEVNNPGAFFVQPANSPLQQLMSEISSFLQEAGKMAPFRDSPRRGALCLAQYSLDGCWYRAAITDVVPADSNQGPGSVSVIFIDYGNQEKVTLNGLVVLDPRFNKVPAQAVHVSLQNVKPAGGESRWSVTANEKFSTYAVNNVVCARVTIVPGRLPCVDLSFNVPDGQRTKEVNIARLLVEEGVAEYIHPPPGFVPKQPASSAASVSSSDGGTGGRSPEMPADAKRQPAQGQSQPQPSQTQQRLTQPAESSSDGKSRSTAPGVPPGFQALPNQQSLYKHLSQNQKSPPIEASTRSQKKEERPARAKHTSGTSASQGSVGREERPAREKHQSAASVSQESVGSSKKVDKPKGSRGRYDGQSQKSQDGRKSQDVRELEKSSNQSQPAKLDQKQTTAAPMFKAKPGFTLAQTIAAQAAESFHDDARSTVSNRSTESMKTARGTSSSASMHTAYDGSISTAGSQRSSGSQQNARKGQRSQGDPQGFHPGARPKHLKKQTMQHPKLPPRQISTKTNDSLLLAMSHIVNPSEFYIHLITADICKLDFLLEELKETYENLTEDFSDFVPAVGMTCVSKYSLDDMWYRVFIVDLVETLEPIVAKPKEGTEGETSNLEFKKTLMAKVLFVDYGNTEWVAASGIKPLANYFFDYPAQAIKCCLAHIEPQDPCKVPNYSLASVKPAIKTKSSSHRGSQTPKATDGMSSLYCSLCDKQLYTVKSFGEHFTCKTHRQIEIAAKVGLLKPVNSTESLSPNTPLSATQLTDHNEGASKNFCDVCCHQAKNEKEYNDHRNSNTHVLADKMSRFCDAQSGAEKQPNTGGWAQVAVDVFKQLAPCENCRMLGWMTKQLTDNDEAIPLILSYHEGKEEVCVNQELVNLGLAMSARFQKKIVEAVATSPSVHTQTASTSHDLTWALRSWNRPREKTGYGHTIIASLVQGTATHSKSQSSFILTVPPKTEGQSVTNLQLSMAMTAWNMKGSGYQEGAAAAPGGGGDDDDEGAVMDSWDPKTSDYFSERNSFEVDDEDTAAVVGYSHQHDRQFCKFYMRGQRCYRGDQCPYEHPLPGENLRDQVPVFYAPSNHSPALPAPDEWVAIQVTSLISAFHFWAQLVWGKVTLDEIQEMGKKEMHDDDGEGLHALEKSINECCKVKSRSEDPNILRAMGEVVIAKYSKNKRWYRARVIDYDETEPCLKVFYCDYGNAEWLPKCDVRTPKPEFLHLPFQAVECYLYGVTPIKGKEEIARFWSMQADAYLLLSFPWHKPEFLHLPFQAVECYLYGVTPIKGKEDIARRNLEPLVMDKTLVGHIITCTASTNTMEIHLFNTMGKHDISLTQYLVQHDFASAIPDHMTDKSISLSSHRHRRISEREEPDSVSCHEMQIPG